jgi:HEAT repeat protein
MTDSYALMELVLADPAALAEHWDDEDWRVRYAAAVAMGESGDPRWLARLHDLMEIEAQRPLYSQPAVQAFVGSYDDTRMAEQLVATEAVWDREYPDDVKEAWRCRGRVRQASLLAVHAIGSATPELVDLIHRLLEDPDEDHSVKAAGAKALARVGDRSSVPALEAAMEFDEWCLRVEARKALATLGGADA